MCRFAVACGHHGRETCAVVPCHASIRESSANASAKPPHSEAASERAAQPRTGRAVRRAPRSSPRPTERSIRGRWARKCTAKQALHPMNAGLVELMQGVGAVAGGQQADAGGEHDHRREDQCRARARATAARGGPFSRYAARAAVVADEAVAGARELEQDGPDQHQADEHVLGPQVAQPQDRHALREQQHREHGGGEAGQVLVPVRPAEPSRTRRDADAHAASRSLASRSASVGQAATARRACASSSSGTGAPSTIG